MGKHIRLYVEKGCWIAAFADDWGNPDNDIIDLFGTHHIPTAFSALTPSAEVKEKISALNPGHRVSLS